jgi:ArsR family transcriptional regulator
MSTKLPASDLEIHLPPEFFQALAEPTRLGVLTRLAVARGPLTVSEVADCCGVHLSGVSRHLKILRQAGVVQATKRGREVLYSLDCEALAASLRKLADALDACHAVCCGGEHDCETRRE